MDNDLDVAAEKTYRAIGRFIFEFSQMEFCIRYHLANELKIGEEYFSAVIEVYDVSLLCSVAIDVFRKSRSKDNATKLKNIINNFRQLIDHRNRVAHGLWVPFMEGGTVHHTSRSKLQSVQAANQAASLERDATAITELRAKFEQEVYRICF